MFEKRIIAVGKVTNGTVQIVESLPDDSRPIAQRTAIALDVLALSEEAWEAFVAGELVDLQEGISDDIFFSGGQW